MPGYFLGVDPGKAGGATLLKSNGKVELWGDGTICSLSFSGMTEHDIALWFDKINFEFGGHGILAAIEKVSSSPQMGRVSVFTFGQSYGFLRGLLVSNNIAFENPSPQRWQKDLNCLSSGDKNVTKRKAQELFPEISNQITHGNADSILIAEWLRRNYHWGKRSDS